jgi:hypothetical protein
MQAKKIMFLNRRDHRGTIIITVTEYGILSNLPVQILNNYALEIMCQGSQEILGKLWNFHFNNEPFYYIYTSFE